MRPPASTIIYEQCCGAQRGKRPKTEIQRLGHIKKDAVTYTSEALQLATQDSTTPLHNININIGVGDSYLSRNSNILVRCSAQARVAPRGRRVEINEILTISSGNSSYGESCGEGVMLE